MLEMDGYPSLVDGKTKLHWGNCKHGSRACWICYQFGAKLGKDFRGKPEFEPKDRKALLHAFGQCHTRNRGFDRLKKFAYHKDFKNNECRYIICTFLSWTNSENSP